MKTLILFNRAKTHVGRQKLRFVSALLCLVLCVFSVNSCSQKQGDPLSYRNAPFKAKISSVGFDVDFEAVVTSEPYENGDRGRWVFEFLSPKSLKGLKICMSDEGTEISLGGQVYASVDLPADRTAGLFQVAEMLSPSEPILSIKSISGRECGLPGIKALTAVKVPSVTVYIDPESGLPIKASTPNGKAYLMISILPSEN